MRENAIMEIIILTNALQGTAPNAFKRIHDATRTLVERLTVERVRQLSDSYLERIKSGEVRVKV